MCVLLSLFWSTFQSLIYELVDEDGCSSSFDISTRITQCAGFSSIRMYDDHDEVSHCTMRLSIELENFQILKSKGLVFAQF